MTTSAPVPPTSARSTLGQTQLIAPVIFVLTSSVVALGLAIGIIALILNPPRADMQLLILFMSGTAGVTLGLAWMIQRLNLMARFPSLRWIVPVTIALTATLIVFNVWVKARLMFISDHDFYLTTALLLFASLISIGFGLFITTHLTRRITILNSAAQVLASGQFSARLNEQGSDEIAQLAKTFNWMTENLARLDEQKRMIDQARRDLIAWVSHDLRTPLTSIRVMLEAIADDVVEDFATQERYIQTCLKEIEHLSSLINDLFELTQIDTGHISLALAATSLSDLISDTLSTMTAYADQHQVKLGAQVADGLESVVLDPHKIQRVLYNLVDNAIRYTPVQGQVHILAQVEQDEVRVDVHNSGVRIEAEHLPHIFERFYRVEKSRTPDHHGRRGTGLGLAIAQGFVQAHQGRIWAASDPNGTTFSFTLPKHPAP